MRISDWSSDVCSSDLRDYVQRLDRHRQGRRAVHIHLSRLKPQNRREHHIRIAANTFEDLVKQFEGHIFSLSNADLVFVCKGASPDQMDVAVTKLRYLFSEDTLTQRERGSASCREQECTYVLITVVAVSIYKQTLHTS